MIPGKECLRTVELLKEASVCEDSPNSSSHGLAEGHLPQGLDHWLCPITQRTEKERTLVIRIAGIFE